MNLKLRPEGLASGRKTPEGLDLHSPCFSYDHPLASSCDDVRGIPLIELKFAHKLKQVDRNSAVLMKRINL